MIVLVDPGATSTNLGDRIIARAVHECFVDELVERGVDVVSIPLHGPIDDTHRRTLRAASDVVVSGTNLLSDHMWFRSAWNWSRSDISLAAGKLTVFGAGWWQYQIAGIDWPTRRWFHSLSGSKSWAVRDVYSADRLTAGGVKALHTSCPTLWGVEEQQMPGGAHRVVVTLTDYTQDRASDGALLNILRERFDEVWLWPQGPGDAAYFGSLGVADSDVLEPSVEAFDHELLQPGTSYVGLRLHGGIRATQLKVPSLVLSVDNRAREISRSVGLVCPSRHDLTGIRTLLGSSERHPLDMPHENIADWSKQWSEY